MTTSSGAGTSDTPMAPSDEYEGLVVMTQEAHDEFVADGCDPHCHACDKKIGVGDRWMLKTFLEEDDIRTSTGLTVGSIRGMACAECVAENRGLSHDEIASLYARFRKLRDATVRPVPQVMAPRHGCFVLPDGTRF